MPARITDIAGLNAVAGFDPVLGAGARLADSAEARSRRYPRPRQRARPPVQLSVPPDGVAAAPAAAELAVCASSCSIRASSLSDTCLIVRLSAAISPLSELRSSARPATGKAMQMHASHAANNRDVLIEVLLHSQQTMGARRGATHYVSRSEENGWCSGLKTM